MQKPSRGRLIRDIQQFFSDQRVTGGLRRRLTADAATIGEGLEQATMGDEARRLLRKELAAVREEIPRITAPRPFSTAFPMNDLHRRIFAVQGAIWRAGGRSGLVAWKKNPWDMVSPTEPPGEGGASIDVRMMRNEYRIDALLISNCAASDTGVVRLAIKGLPGGTNPPWVTVHEVAFTDTLSGVPVAAALPVARKKDHHWVITLLPGMTRQVWLTIHSKGIPAGSYRGRMAIEGIPDDVPLHVTVYPFDFPDQPTLHLGGWDYTDRERCYEVTSRNRTAFIHHLRERYVDTPWAQASVMPYGTYDRNGTMTEPPRTASFEQWLKRWPGARRYHVFAAVRKTFAGFPLGTPAFEKAVGSWITWWVKQLARWKIRPEQVSLLLVDEPHTAEQDQVIIAYAKVIRAAQPDIVIWEDPTWRDPTKATPELFDVSDVLCPNLPMWIEGGQTFAAFYAAQRATGKRLWFYSCSGPGKLLDPYGYYRLQHWFCWKHDAEGSGFWAFGDASGASTWNEYASRVGAYTPLFLGATTVTAGKHMEAIREGVQDYEYLRMLRDRINELSDRGITTDTLQSARRLLAEGPDRVLACMTSRSAGRWEKAKDRSTADRVRAEILECLMRLRAP